MGASEVTSTLTLHQREAEGPGRSPEPGLVALFSEETRALPSPMAIMGPSRLGRDPKSADLVVPDNHVSRLHARVEPRPTGLWIADAGSHNGTFVDGVHLVDRGLTAPFGSVVRVGNTILWVSADVRRFESPSRAFQMLGGPWLKTLLSQLEVVARDDSPVLIQGETGTGKERVAHEVHIASQRRGPFVAVNCGALPSELIEAELFGHSKGAFSGSEKSRLGLFRSAQGGTLLLDEIGELSAQAQVKLLRVLEEKAVRPLGQDRPEDVDVRVLAATNRALHELVETGAFRRDLLHRVAATRLELPPLRERREDIPLLASSFLAEREALGSAVLMENLMSREWTGNVRELRNVLRVAAATALAVGRERVLVEDMPSDSRPPPSRPAPPSQRNDEAVLRERIVTALELCSGNVAETARRLGMARARLYEAFQRLGITPADFRR